MKLEKVKINFLVYEIKSKKLIAIYLSAFSILSI